MIISFIRDGDHEEETPPKGCLFPGGQSVAPGPQGARRFPGKEQGSDPFWPADH
jgi:hypothetical protein